MVWVRIGWCLHPSRRSCRSRRLRTVGPPGSSRPPTWSPGILPVELILARTPQRAIGLTGIRAYPTGFGCTLHLRLREVIPGEQSNFGAFNMFGDGVDPAGEFADYYLRFGVGFADGRKATNLNQRWDFDESPAPDPPTLRLVRWEGYDLLAWEVDVWVWGLPPPGPLVFACEWPARGISETRVEIDTGPVLEAAGRAVPIWPDQTPP
jgi:hypothetical protein